MRVIPVASTITRELDLSDTGYLPWISVIDSGDYSVQLPEEADELAEFAGRNCYQAWGRKNPATATNESYLANILDHGHESVLEHSSVTFYVDGVSRSLLAELTRHRHLSFSVVSQRYVRLTDDQVVTPPMIEEFGHLVARKKMYASWTIDDLFTETVNDAFYTYNLIADRLIDEGLPRKKALEAARSVLPNCVDSPMVVTGNLRAWRDVLRKRHSVHADEEMQDFARVLLTELRRLAPNSFQDIPEVPFE